MPAAIRRAVATTDSSVTGVGRSLWVWRRPLAASQASREGIGQCTYDVHWYGYQGMSTDRFLKLTTDGGASFTNASGSGTIHMWGGAI